MGWIQTDRGWKQLQLRRNDVGRPVRVSPLQPARIGKEPVIMLDEDYDDQGRFIGQLVHAPMQYRAFSPVEKEHG